MKKIILFIVCLYLGGIIMSSALDKVDVFTVVSSKFKNNDFLPNQQVYNGYGCSGGNIAPDLSWINAPQNTKSFAIICHDPDAPRANGWYHWLLVNIPSNVNSYKNTLPEGSFETITDFKTYGYGGACPPVGHGIHHYNFTVYALDVEKLDVEKDSKPIEVEKKILAHSIAKTSITALYERK